MTRQQKIEQLRRQLAAAQSANKHKRANAIHAQLVPLVAAQMRADDRAERKQRSAA